MEIFNSCCRGGRPGRSAITDRGGLDGGTTNMCAQNFQNKPPREGFPDTLYYGNTSEWVRRLDFWLICVLGTIWWGWLEVDSWVPWTYLACHTGAVPLTVASVYNRVKHLDRKSPLPRVLHPLQLTPQQTYPFIKLHKVTSMLLGLSKLWLEIRVM